MSNPSAQELPDFQLLFEKSPGMYLVLAPDLRMLAASDAYLRATMKTREKMLGRCLFDVFPDNPADPYATGVRNLRASLERVLRLRKPDAMPLQKYDLLGPDGTFEDRYWSPLNTPILDEQGNVRYILHQVEDVTQQVELQEGLDVALAAHKRQRKEQESPDQVAPFQLLANAVKDYAHFMLDPRGRVKTWNEGAERFTGYREHEVLGRPFAVFFPPEATREGIPEQVLETASAKGDVKTEGWYVRKDGSRFWADVLVAAIQDAQGNMVGFAQVLWDLTERRRREEALEESLERVVSVVENSPDAIYVKDTEGRFVFVNSAAAALTGHVPDELLGKPSNVYFPPEFARRMRAFEQKVMDTGCTLSVEESVRLPSGVEKVFLTTKYPYRAVDGQMLGVMGISRDITDRKRGEDQQARYAAIVAFSPNAVLSIDAETDTLESWNRGAESLYGYTAEEILGKPRSLLLPPELREQYEGTREAIRRGESQEYLETVALRKDGTRVAVRLSQFPVKDAKGRLLAIGVVARDITEHKRLIDALKESEDRYRRLVEVSPEAIMIDQGWTISYANPAAASIFGAPDSTAIVGRSLMDFIHPDDSQSFTERMRQVRQEGKTSLLIEERIVRLDGTIASVETTVSPFTMKGQPGVLAIIRDITKRKRAMEEAALQAAELKKVQELNCLKDHFLSTISHEMRTPLSLIMGYTELLEEVCPQQDVVVGIREGSRRLTEQIDKILDYSALVSGTLSLYKTELNLREIAEHARAIMAERFRLKGVTFKVDVAPATPDILGDFRRITQALLELLENALKFTPVGGQVGLRIFPADAQVRLDVWDSGSGIPETEFGTIWTAFSQLAVGDAFRTGGLGLGLTIVKMLAELHGGKVAVVSQPGKGSTFSIFLPAATEAETRTSHHESSESGKARD